MFKSQSNIRQLPTHVIGEQAGIVSWVRWAVGIAVIIVAIGVGVDLIGELPHHVVSSELIQGPPQALHNHLASTLDLQRKNKTEKKKKTKNKIRERKMKYRVLGSMSDATSQDPRIARRPNRRTEHHVNPTLGGKITLNIGY